jgi:hypothetical protein
MKALVLGCALFAAAGCATASKATPLQEALHQCPNKDRACMRDKGWVQGPDGSWWKAQP